MNSTIFLENIIDKSILNKIQIKMKTPIKKVKFNLEKNIIITPENSCFHTLCAIKCGIKYTEYWCENCDNTFHE